jgi:hypothetical protein
MRTVRSFALGLPEAAEADHHGMASFRVRGKILATVPDPAHVRIMLDEPEVLAACAEAPGSCERLHWGTRLAGVVVEVRSVPTPLVCELLVEAWARKAPAALARTYGTSPG